MKGVTHWPSARPAIHVRVEAMTEQVQDKQSFSARYTAWRSKLIYDAGERFTRAVGGFFGRQSLVEDKPFLSNAQFPFLEKFSENWEQIAAEARTILKNRDAIPAFQEISPEQHLIAKDKSWRTFFFYGFGQQVKKNCKQAPFTTSMLEQVPNIEIAWFSILAPGYHIPPHKGVTKGILRAHLGLLIPKEQENCKIRVDNEIQHWEPGKVFVLDDTFEHEVWNNTDEERVILIFDFDRPMKWPGRALLRFFIWAMKFTAFYQTPKKNLGTFEDRFEAATRQSNENMEKLADAAQEARERRNLH